jgi:hypothetical protein
MLSDVDKDGKCKDGFQNHWSRTSIARSEYMKIMEWIHYHRLKCDWDGDFVIAQTASSGIGTNTIVRCGKCNETSDVTDYSAW